VSGRDFSTTRRRSGTAGWEIGLLVSGALVAVLAAHAAGTARATLGAARARVEQLRREADADRSRIRTIESSPGPTERFAAQALLTAEAEPPRVVADVVALLPPDVRLEALGLTYGSRLEVDLQVAARRSGAYDRFLERLAESPRFRDVLPGAESRDGDVRAAVRALYQPSGPR